MQISSSVYFANIRDVIKRWRLEMIHFIHESLLFDVVFCRFFQGLRDERVVTVSRGRYKQVTENLLQLQL